MSVLGAWLTATLFAGRLVAYNPRLYDPNAGIAPSARSIVADARMLRRLGFRTVTTYGSGPALARACRLLKRGGIARVLVGVWDPRDPDERAAAVQQRRCADGYVVGSEGLTFARYSREELLAAITAVRDATSRPVTTREPLGAYAADPDLLAVGDWVFPIVHPYFAGLRDPESACAWTAGQLDALRALVPAGRAVVIAETGLPTAGAPGLDEQGQAAFFDCLERRGTPFVFFEGFDQPWKTTLPIEPHWGLYRSDKRPKAWAAAHRGRRR